MDLTKFQRIPDYKPAYDGGQEAFIFKKNINGHEVYIKIKIETHKCEESLVCISFHKMN